MPGRKLLWASVFSIAMGFAESAVVVYLRVIYYPEGFQFPLVPISKNIALAEFLREAATLVMLLSAGVLAGSNAIQRFAYFIFCFAVWDICYYLFLKLLLNWPESLLTWDILFLIPVPWVGPVITPVIVACTMILLAAAMLYADSKNRNARLRWSEWSLLIAGSAVLMVSWMWDYSSYVLARHPLSSVWTLSGDAVLFSLAEHYIPRRFCWWLFLPGEVICLSAIGKYWYRNLRGSPA